MRFKVATFRNGIQVISACPGFQEICDVLASITLKDIEERRLQRQAIYDRDARQKGGKARKAGIQDGLNSILHLGFERLGWRSQVPVFEPDEETGKGFWTMDFAKRFPGPDLAVGLEATFNHAEALTWTPLRLTLAHESERVLQGSHIDVGAIIIGTDQLKGNSKEGLRMDSAVGTYERLRTVLPKIRAVLPAPLVVFALDWGDGGFSGTTENLLPASTFSTVPSTRSTGKKG